MNLLYRIIAAIYSFIFAVFFGLVFVSPFGDKLILEMGLDFVSTTFYQSSKYDIFLFIIGLLFCALNIFILITAIRGTKSGKYITTETDNGLVRISSYSIENIALGLSKKFNGVKEAKARVRFHGKDVSMLIRLTVMPGVNVPDLCKGIQARVKDSVEATLELNVSQINVNVDAVASQNQE